MPLPSVYKFANAPCGQGTNQTLGPQPYTEWRHRSRAQVSLLITPWSKDASFWGYRVRPYESVAPRAIGTISQCQCDTLSMTVDRPALSAGRKSEHAGPGKWRVTATFVCTAASTTKPFGDGRRSTRISPLPT